jgi:hypothetical protein
MGRAVESVHKTSDSSAFKSPAPTPTPDSDSYFYSFIKAQYVLYDTGKPIKVKKGIIKYFITTT